MAAAFLALEAEEARRSAALAEVELVGVLRDGSSGQPGCSDDVVGGTAAKGGGPGSKTAQVAAPSACRSRAWTRRRSSTKLALRREEELSRVRVDTNFMLCVDVSGEHSVLQCAAAADNSGRNLSVPGP